MTSNKIEIQPTKTESAPEETYVDLLPFEMERVEAAMTIMENLKSASEAGREALSSIRAEVDSTKKGKENSWGHEWRESPIIDRDMKPLSEMTGLGTSKEAISKSYWDRAHAKPDPILASVLEDKEVILDNAAGYDLAPLEYRLPVGKDVHHEHLRDRGGDKEDEELPETD